MQTNSILTLVILEKKLDSSIEKTETNNVIKYLNIPNNSSFFLSPITSNDLINVFNNFKPKKSLDTFNFNMDFLKIISPYILHPLLYLFNKSFSSDMPLYIIPLSLKSAKVVPFYKYTNKHDFNNYRPISLTNQFSKVLEQIFYTKIIIFLEKHNIINNSQF